MSVLYRPLPQLWSSSARFVIVCAAAILSLGDLWRLPSLMTTYGGGAFLSVYAGALFIMGLPVLSAQIVMARGCHTDLPGVIKLWTRDARYSRLWVATAYIALLGSLLLLAAYAVVASWALAYSLHALTGSLNLGSVGEGTQRFITFARDGERGLGWLLLFILLLVATTARGLRLGTETVMRTLALSILALLSILAITALWVAPSHASSELMYVDFTKLGARGVLEALYQAFFSLSLGTGVIISLSSHLPARAPAIRLSAIVIVISQGLALAFVFVLMRLMSVSTTELEGGAQRVFEVLPSAITPAWAVALLFTLVAMVAMTTGIGLFELLVQATAHRLRQPRLPAAIYTGLVTAILGIAAQNAFGALSDWRLWERNIFDWLSLISVYFLIPITGLMLCVLVGRVLGRRRLVAAWHGGDATVNSFGFALWHWLLRYPARIALILVVAYSLGALELIEAIWYPESSL